MLTAQATRARNAHEEQVGPPWCPLDCPVGLATRAAQEGLPRCPLDCPVVLTALTVHAPWTRGQAVRTAQVLTAQRVGPPRCPLENPFPVGLATRTAQEGLPRCPLDYPVVLTALTVHAPRTRGQAVRTAHVLTAQQVGPPQCPLENPFPVGLKTSTANVLTAQQVGLPSAQN